MLENKIEKKINLKKINLRQPKATCQTYGPSYEIKIILLKKNLRRKVKLDSIIDSQINPMIMGKIEKKIILNKKIMKTNYSSQPKQTLDPSHETRIAP